MANERENPDPMCLCGEPESEHYDEVDPPPPPRRGESGGLNRCMNRSWCGCEGFEEAEQEASA